MASSPRSTPRPYGDLDDEPTTVDRLPWHVASEDSTGVRVIAPGSIPPRPAPRPVPRVVTVVTVQPPEPVPQPAPARSQAIVPRAEPRRSEALMPWPAAGPTPCSVEDLESLSLPAPLREDMLAQGARPEGEAQMRIAIIRVVRELGRDYRVQRGRILRTDAVAIEIAQRQLVAHSVDVAAGRMDARALTTEIARHGALLGEIVVRRLGGDWLDVSGDHPGLWTMSVPPCSVFAPIGRVQRFLAQQNREQDLVGFYIDLDAARTRRR